VIDKDRHPSYTQALDVITRAQPKATFPAVTSVPCFEYWLLLHFIYTDQPFHVTGNSSICTMVTKELRQYWPEYEKGSFGVFGRLLGELEFAKANAKHGLRAAESNYTDNPSTRIHELVEYLQKLILSKN
jgi:hypothetical protein